MWESNIQYQSRNDSISDFSLLLFFIFGSSGQVNSKMLKVLVLLSIIVISGFRGVMQTSIGMVPPVAVVWPARSLNISNFDVSMQFKI